MSTDEDPVTFRPHLKPSDIDEAYQLAISAAESRGEACGRQWAIDTLRDGERYGKWWIARVADDAAGDPLPPDREEVTHAADYLEAASAEGTPDHGV